MSMENSKITYFKQFNLTINCLTELEQIILEEISNNSKVARDGL